MAIGKAIESPSNLKPQIAPSKWIDFVGLGYRQVIPAFFIDRDAKFTLLFSHGNAEDLGMIIQYFRNSSASAWTLQNNSRGHGTW